MLVSLMFICQTAPVHGRICSSWAHGTAVLVRQGCQVEISVNSRMPTVESSWQLTELLTSSKFHKQLFSWPPVQGFTCKFQDVKADHQDPGLVFTPLYGLQRTVSEACIAGQMYDSKSVPDPSHHYMQIKLSCSSSCCFVICELCPLSKHCEQQMKVPTKAHACCTAPKPNWR